MAANKILKSKRSYLDQETGTTIKKWQGHLSVALIYPNTYAVGMSSLGFQTVYRLINQLEKTLCERFFLPDGTTRSNDPLISVETHRPLAHFDILAFSIAFENDYPHILSILEKADIPFKSSERDASSQLIIGGGVATFLNPEPIAPFIDAFILGEVEETLPFFLINAKSCDLNHKEAREQFLLNASRTIPGIYVPAFYTVQEKGDGSIKEMAPLFDLPKTVRRVFVKDLSSHQTVSTIQTPHASFSNVHLIEVSRGCPHGCRFCAAGYIYRPYRHRSFESLTQTLDQGCDISEHIGLVGAAVSDVPKLSELCLLGEKKGVRLSFSSLRADCLTPELARAIAKGDVKTATIAPEAGSERMRRIINKGITESHILKATRTLVENGIFNLKLYFMIGLPTERDEDISAIIDLVHKIKEIFLITSRKQKRIGTITVGIHTFVPKPFTPFQWVGMEGEKSLKTKIKIIRNTLKKVPNIIVHADPPKRATLQALFARGDRKVSDFLLLGHKNKGNWPQTFKESPMDTSFYIHREREETEILPWDFIDQRLKKSYLWKEYEKALKEMPSPVCDVMIKNCKRCGACTIDETLLEESLKP